MVALIDRDRKQVLRNNIFWLQAFRLNKAIAVCVGVRGSPISAAQRCSFDIGFDATGKAARQIYITAETAKVQGISREGLKRDHPLLVNGNDATTSFRAGDDSFDRLVELRVADDVETSTRSQQRRLVQDVRKQLAQA